MLVSAHDGGVAVLYCLKILVLHIHVLTKLGIHGGHDEPVEDILHVGVVLIVGVVQLYQLPVVLLLVGLVEYAEHPVQPVVDLPVQKRNLDDNAFMDEAVDERVGESIGHLAALVVTGLVVDIEHWHFDVSDPMPENIHRHHRKPVGRAQLFLHHVLWVGILGSEILPEAQGLGLQPSLLQLDENQAQRPVVLADARPEVDAEHGDVVAVAIGVLVAAYLHLHHLFLQQRRKDGAGDPLVLHQIFEDGVIDGICYSNDHNTTRFLFYDYSSRTKIGKKAEARKRTMGNVAART